MSGRSRNNHQALKDAALECSICRMVFTEGGVAKEICKFW
jgi:hypothetical protein